jgi:hypothetical protein
MTQIQIKNKSPQLELQKTNPPEPKMGIGRAWFFLYSPASCNATLLVGFYVPNPTTQHQHQHAHVRVCGYMQHAA